MPPPYVTSYGWDDRNAIICHGTQTLDSTCFGSGSDLNPGFDLSLFRLGSEPWIRYVLVRVWIWTLDSTCSRNVDYRNALVQVLIATTSGIMQL
jgi:hypothetical protein